MLIHIVRPNENISKIANCYHCEVEDIVSNNKHITDYQKLAPGTKLKIPFITKEKKETLEETESFISDYYPKFKGLDGYKFAQEEVKAKDTKIIEAKKENINSTNDSLEETKEEVNNVSSVEKTEKHLSKPIINHYHCGYFGNIVPKIDPKYIRKI